VQGAWQGGGDGGGERWGGAGGAGDGALIGGGGELGIGEERARAVIGEEREAADWRVPRAI
jgi:hypothetical protein